jgi:hypothetical protein
VLPEAMLTDKNPCDFAQRWGLRIDVGTIALALARAIVVDPRLQGLVRSISLIKMLSGYRTEEEQRSLIARGGNVAPDHLSTHRSCPATGFDLRVEGLMNPGSDPQAAAAWRIIGALAQQVGLRWGGGSKWNAALGIPSDFNHFDAGPRVQ